MRRFVMPVVFAIGAGVAFNARMGESASSAPTSSELAVHEWGTFTTVAGVDGRAIDWLPLGGPSDLPCFVEHFNSDPYVKVFPTTVASADSSASRQIRIRPAGVQAGVAYDAARRAMAARVRMETPVLYFYSDRDTTVRVLVHFHHGLITEWYPPAAVSQAAVSAALLRAPNEVSAIEWPNVRVTPAAQPAFPVEREQSHYYAARNTDASSVSVGGQHERFLFYRGVADFDAPLSAAVLDAKRVVVKDLTSSEIPAVILFERRGSKIGFRVVGAMSGERTISGLTLDGSIAELRLALEQVLVSNGLTAKEASAMIETWRDSWFEEGSRVFYVVPRRTVDEILALEVAPTPSHVTRVFVGRMEVLTPATVRAVRAAVDAQDQETLARYARFLGPIADRILSGTTDVQLSARIRDVTNAALASYLRRTAICE